MTEFEAAAVDRSLDNPSDEADRLEREAQQIARDIDGYVREISELGVQLKGFDLGLVDFPEAVDGRPVLWC